MVSNTTDFEDTLAIYYLACFDLSCLILLLVLLICLITLTLWSETVTKNKLTMTPYYAMIGYSTLAIIQFVICISVDSSPDLVEIVAINKLSCLFTAIFTQHFEWFHTWYLIRFQIPVDANSLGVERMRFNAKEKKIKQGAIVFGAVYFFAVNTSIIVAEVIQPNKANKEPVNQDDCIENLVWQTREFINFVGVVICIIFVFLSVILFSTSAYKRHRYNWNKHKSSFILQATGTFIILAQSTYGSWPDELGKDVSCETYASPLMSPKYLISTAF